MTSTKLGLLKKKWLSKLGLADDKSVIDCDPIKGTVKMLIDGEVRERQTVENWQRCMGYFRPVANFNIGKKQEASERKYFAIDKLSQ